MACCDRAYWLRRLVDARLLAQPCAPLAIWLNRCTWHAMLRHPVHRLTTTFFVVLSLLFAQLALANYAALAVAAPAPKS
jgi:hypothetical protein